MYSIKEEAPLSGELHLWLSTFEIGSGDARETSAARLMGITNVSVIPLHLHFPPL